MTSLFTVAKAVQWILTSCAIARITAKTGTSDTPECSPLAEEGTPYNFTRTINITYTDGIYLKYYHPNVGLNAVALCIPHVRDLSPRCLEFISQIYRASIELTNGIDQYLVTVTVLSPERPRDEAEWVWETGGDDGIELDRCKLRFYSVPKVSLTNCPYNSDANQGYIKAGSSATCSCHMTERGLPEGRVQWIDTGQGKVVADGNGNGDSVTLSIQPHKNFTEQTYMCQGISTYKAGPNVTFTAKYAYGPDAVVISATTKSSVLDICTGNPNTTTNLRLFCDVDISSYSPGVNVHLVGSPPIGHRVNRSKQALNSTTERYIFDISLPEQGGRFRPQCVAKNSAYEDLVAAAETEIVLRMPPSTAPSVAINNEVSVVGVGGQVNVLSGVAREFWCEIVGGFPEVSSTTMQCGNMSVTSVGRHSVLLMSVSQEMNGQSCKCWASHVTGCYHKRTEFTLDVLYKSYIESFEIVTDQNTTIITSGMLVTLTCNSTGNPAPNVTIHSQRLGKLSWSNATVLKGEFHTSLILTRVVDCLDTDTYWCTADNSVGTAISSRHKMNVFCPTQLQNSTAIIRPGLTFDLQLTLDIPVFGYPPPNSMTLSRETNCPVEINGSVLPFVLVNPHLYTITYTPGDSPFGGVFLDLGQVSGRMLGLYQVSIGNRLVPDLRYNFSVDESFLASKPDDESSDSVLVAVVVAVVILVITNVIVAFVFHFLGRRYERKAVALEKATPRVEYHPSPVHQEGDTSPPPSAYVDMNFIYLDTPSSSEDHLQHVNSHHSLRANNHHSQRANNYHPNQNHANNRTNHAQNPARRGKRVNASATTPPGNFYTNDFPEGVYGNRESEEENVYANTDSSTSRTIRTQNSDYERLRESGAYSATDSKPTTLSLTESSSNTYSEIQMPTAKTKDSNSHDLSPNNDITPPFLPPKKVSLTNNTEDLRGLYPISRVYVGASVSPEDSNFKLRSESETSDDVYQSIDSGRSKSFSTNNESPRDNARSFDSDISSNIHSNNKKETYPRQLSTNSHHQLNRIQTEDNPYENNGQSVYDRPKTLEDNFSVRDSGIDNSAFIAEDLHNNDGSGDGNIYTDPDQLSSSSVSPKSPSSPPVSSHYEMPSSVFNDVKGSSTETSNPNVDNNNKMKKGTKCENLTESSKGSEYEFYDGGGVSPPNKCDLVDRESKLYTLPSSHPNVMDIDASPYSN